MTARWRHLLLGLALALTLVGVLIDGPQTEPPAQAVPAAAGRPAARAPVAADPAPVLGTRRPLGAVAGNPFAVRQWQPPAPAPVAPPVAAVERPATPPLPFVYVGQLQEQGRTTVFLGQGARTHLVHAGDVVGDYRVVAISATAISFLHVALQQQQSLSFGSSP